MTSEIIYISGYWPLVNWANICVKKKFLVESFLGADRSLITKL